MDAIENYLKQQVLNMIETDFTQIFNILYLGIAQVSTDMTITPSNWMGGNIWGFMKQIHLNVMIPVAGSILAFIVATEIYHVVIERNAMKDIDISALYMLFFKMAIGVLVVSHAADIVEGLFDLGNWAVIKTVGIIPEPSVSPVDLGAQVKDMLASSSEYNAGICFGFWLTLFVIKLIVLAINIVAMIVVYGRLLQMVLYACFSPVPLATFMNKEWNVGQNYIKNIFALAFQGFLIIFIFGVYSIILFNNNLSIDPNGNIYEITLLLFEQMGWGMLLCMMLLKTNSITQSVFGAH